MYCESGNKIYGYECILSSTLCLALNMYFKSKKLISAPKEYENELTNSRKHSLFWRNPLHCTQLTTTVVRTCQLIFEPQNIKKYDKN